MTLPVDPRTAQLAQVLVRRSLQVTEGDRVVLAATDFSMNELLRECYRLALKAGAFVEIDVGNMQQRDAGGLMRVFFENASDEQLTDVSQLSRARIDWADKFLLISRTQDDTYLRGIPLEKLSRYRAAHAELHHKIMDKTWVVTSFPGEAMAKNAEMTMEECIDFYYQACLPDYDALSARILQLQNILDAGKWVHIIGPGTDLRLGIEDRLAAGAIVGRRNVPDGECFLAPLEDSVDGHITYELPQMREGHEVQGVELTFEKGQITKATAEKGNDFLQTVLDEHPGNRRLGELGIGMNPFITRYMKNLMFDEKILGTVHMAVGRAYGEERGGGKNQGSIHWDLVKDLRMPGTSVSVDDRVIMKNGKIVI